MNQTPSAAALSQAPRIASMRVIPVAGHDDMLLNLSGAHGPFFTRNLLLLKDSSGRTGVGEVPGGEKIRQTLEDASALIVGQPLGAWNAILNTMRAKFAERNQEVRESNDSWIAQFIPFLPENERDAARAREQLILDKAEEPGPKRKKKSGGGGYNFGGGSGYKFGG